MSPAFQSLIKLIFFVGLVIFSFNVKAIEKCSNNLSDSEMINVAMNQDAKQNYKRSIKCLKLLIKRNHDYGYAGLGYYYANGIGLKQDFKKAYNNFLQASKQNNAISMDWLSYLYFQGLGVKRDEEKAFDYAKTAFELGNQESEYRLAEYYLMGSGTSQNYIKSFEIFTNLSLNNNPNAQYWLGYHYFLGLGVEQNIEKGIYWTEEAAKNGNTYAEEELIMMYGSHEPEKKEFSSNYLTYIKMFEIHNHKYGPNRYIEDKLWKLEYEGKDKEAAEFAVEFLDEAIKNNDEIYKEHCAAASFATLKFYAGYGVKQDLDKAVYYSQFSNKHEACNYPTTWNMMGTHYQRGEGFEINHQRSLDYFIKTVLAGNTIGFWGLAEAYKNGWGIKRNFFNAYICYQLLYRNYWPRHDQRSKPRVEKEIKNLEKILTKDQINDAEIKLSLLKKDYNKLLSILEYENNTNDTLQVINKVNEESLNVNEKISKKISEKQFKVLKESVSKNLSSSDINPPIITIDENKIVMDGPVAYFEAKITDESQIAAVFIDGDPIDPGNTNNGEVILKQTLFIGLEDKKLEIVAYDKWGQSSKQSIIIAKATLDIKKDFGKYYALIIGINEYENLVKLDTAVNDAVELANIIKNKYNFEEIVLLTDNEATRENIIKELYKFRKKLTPKDNFLLYYAGHGKIDKEINDGYWQPVDADRDIPTNWINNSFLTGTIKGMKAKHVLVIADSCYSGSLLRGDTEAITLNDNNRSAILDRLINKKARYVFTSGGNEPVVDGGGGDHSVFAEKLLNTLKNNKKNITGSELSQIIIPKVIVNAEQTPEYSPLHKTGHDGGDFIFVPN